MPAFDVDGFEVAEDLDSICWEVREKRGSQNVQRHVAHETIHRVGAWAVVLVAGQDYKQGQWQSTRFVLTRYRKLAGAWRLQNHFRLPESPLLLLGAAVPRFLEDVHKQEKKLEPCGSSFPRASSRASHTETNPTPLSSEHEPEST